MQVEKNVKELIEETERLKIVNEKLQRQLHEARETFEAFKIKKIDALVSPVENNLKVFTEITADKTYRTLIEKMHEGAVIANKKGIILYCNSYFATMVNKPLQKVIGSHLIDFLEDSFKVEFEGIFKQGWGNAIKEEIQIISKDKISMPVLVSVNTLNIDYQSVMNFIFTDLTIQNENQKKLKQRAKEIEQKNIELESAYRELIIETEERRKSEQELSIANIDVKELGDLNIHKENILATLSHDLRSPLTGIIALTEHLKDRYEKMDSSKVKESLALINKASTDELNMLDSLVEWARIKYATDVFNPKKIQLTDAVYKVFEALKQNALANDLLLTIEVGENCTVYVDEKMLYSILQNIISNSIKHSKAKGKITVYANKQKETIVIEIKDNGIGISNEIKEKLFTPQVQSLLSGRLENKGAGIGLLLVKGFVEKNGGEIWVESEEGVGTSFFFSLPIEKTQDGHHSLNVDSTNNENKA